MKAKKILIAVTVIVGGGIAYYLISPLFITIRLDEPKIPVAVEPVVTEIEQQKEQPAETTPEPPRITETAKIPIVGAPGHPASGVVFVVDVNGKKHLRYEDLKTINGPDIYVYLSKDLEAKEFVNLGRVRATEGNVNYDIPPDVDPKEYPYAMTWCKMFGVLFNSAKLF